MTTTDSFDRRLQAWLDREALGRVPNHLDEVLVVTRATAQRPAWSSLERWVPMSSLVRERVALPRHLLRFGVVGLLVLSLLAVALLVAGQRNQLNLGPASNGRILFVDGLLIASTAADGSDRRTIATLAGGAGGLAISPDGRRLAYVDELGASIQIVPVDEDSERGPGSVSIKPPDMTGVGTPSWSPRGDSITFVAGNAQGDHLFVAAADGSSVREIGAGEIDRHASALDWATWSADAAWIGFLAYAGDPRLGTAFLIRPDGSELHAAVGTGTIDAGDGGFLGWSPDPAAQRLLYVKSSGWIATFDMATGAEVLITEGFWPAWSPAGDRIAYWHDGANVIPATAVLASPEAGTDVFPAFTGMCADHLDLARSAFCGRATWSPDGTRLIAPDISGDVILSLLADGTGGAVVIDIAATDGVSGVVVWQPVRP